MAIDVPITFGEVRKCIGISIFEDPYFEEDETFYVELQTIRIHVIVTIINDGRLYHYACCAYC